MQERRGIFVVTGSDVASGFLAKTRSTFLPIEAFLIMIPPWSRVPPPVGAAL